MGFIDSFLGLMFSPLGLPFWMGIGAAVGILIGVWIMRPKRNQVMKLIPSDKRGFELDIVEENANFIYCPGIETLPPQRFLKFRPGYVITQKRRFGAKFRKLNRYFAREGTAYLQRIESGKLTNIPLALGVKATCGEEDYETVREHAPDFINALELAKINVTVDLEEDPLTPTGMKTVSEENIKQEQDKQASQTFWKEKGKALQQAFIHNMAYIGTGFAIAMVVAIFLKWIPLQTAPPPPG